MGRRMLTRYGIHVPRDVVIEGQRMLDPEGVESRRRHRLRRREYINAGPNYALHIDQYDKLRTYGFGIHGAIDGFSRRVVWLRVASTNRDPAVTASYFVDFAKEIQAVPRCIQVDRGTENTRIADIQTAFHEEYFANQQGPCVMYSASPHNQRIERFWRTLFDMMVNYWLDSLRNLTEIGILDCTLALNKECLRFALMQVIQSELDEVRVEWNQHRTRNVARAIALPGKPDLMYFLPHLFGAQDFRLPVQVQEIEAVKHEFTSSPPINGCGEEFEAVCQDLLLTHNKGMPSSFAEGIELFQWLLDKMQL